MGLVLCALSLANQAGAASVSGTVYDEIHDQFINGCEIKIVETGQLTYTSRGGRFNVYNLDAGTYTFVARGIGLPASYQTLTINTKDDDIVLNVIITDEEVYELEPITVVGSLVGRAKALNIQKASDNIVNVISSDAIGQFVDRNAAEALQRQPGVTVIDSQGEGKYIVIRGSSPAWNQVMIDGVNVATPEENGRTTALNIISTDQLESIEVTKSWTPDKPAGSVGGTVNLITRSALDRNERFASVEGAWGQYDYSDAISWRYNLVYGDVIRLGREDRKLGIQISFNKSIDNRGSQTLSAGGWSSNTTPNLQGATPRGFSLSGLNYKDYEIERDRTAAGGKIEFQLNNNNRFYISASYNSYDDKETLQELEINASTGSSVSYRGSLYFNETLATELGYDLDDPDVIARLALSSTNSGKKLTYDEAEQLGEIYFNPETKNYEKYIAAGDTQRRFQQIKTNDRIDTYQFGGKHNLFDNLTVDYKIYTSEAEKEWTNNGLYLDSPELSFVIELDPDDGYLPTMTVNNSLNQVNDPEMYVLNNSRGQVYSYEYYSNDKRKGFETNIGYSFKVFGIQTTTRVGVTGDFRDKEYRRNFQKYNDIEMEGDDVLTLSSDYFAGELSSSFLSSSGKTYEFGPLFDAKKTLSFLQNTPDAITLVQTANDINYNITDAVLKNYAAEENITSAYLMQKATIGKWSIVGGFRCEHTENGFGNNIVLTDINGTFIIPGYWQYLDQDLYCEYVKSTRSYDDVLPALLVRRELWKDMILRMSVSKGLSRPTFTNLVPFEIVSISGAMYGRTIRLPNVDLEPMRTNNFDFSLEQYLKGIGLVSFDFFYKQLDGAIYEATRSNVAAADNAEISYYSHKYIASDIQANAATWTTEKMENTGKGKLYGIEMSFDSKLTFLPWELDGLGVSANYTLVDSSVELLMDERLGEKVPLFQQSKQSGNLSLYYEKHGLLARVSYVWRSKYLDSVQAGETTINNLIQAGELSNALDTYADDFQRIDVLVRYKVNQHLNVFIEGTNLTDEPIRFYRGDASRLSSIKYTGTTWFIGAKLSL